ncbi:PRC-barrel domain-containing protein [Streptomyces cyanogenus]|uniref:PRC-barrel domain protein n=1 Tax=Streptomyces cyanogenus TaxID=80860 RepID=A0ABX7TT04_STRCY|nr:PRC-barrel domain-containing protein [Streptomyces cyanogenus]QTD99830.1 PRC-barrel domain protein [Streptomyces cyanogenus]
MLFSQAFGLPVITADDATSVGKVADLTVDAHDATVAAVRLSGAADRAELAWSAVEAVGPDAVIVRSRVTAEQGQDRVPAHHRALGSRVLTEHGVEHGTVRDIAFDPVSGRILTLYTALGEIAGARLMGLGSYAMVVRADPA